MRKLIEATHVSLGGEVGTNRWAFPYLDEDHQRYSSALLAEADALLLGRKTYEAFSVSYPRMETDAPGDMGDFVRRMNRIPKYVATTTLTEFTWNAHPLDGDVVDAIQKLKAQPGGSLLKFGTGMLDPLLLEHRLVDEYHFWLTPAAVPATVQPLFDGVEGAPPLELQQATPFRSGVVALRYAPARGDSPARDAG